jgi:hypothetical protein
MFKLLLLTCAAPVMMLAAEKDPVAKVTNKVQDAVDRGKKAVDSVAEDIKDSQDAAKKREAAKEGVIPLAKVYAENAKDVVQGKEKISSTTATYLKLAGITAALLLLGYFLFLRRK